MDLSTTSGVGAEKPFRGDRGSATSAYLRLLCRTLESLPLLAAIAILWTSGPLFADDFFIHLRIARNFILGQGLYFNPGEPLLVSSAPLYTILLSIVVLSFDRQWPVGVMSLQSLALVFAWYQLRNLFSARVGLIERIGIVSAVPLLLLDSAIAGMETPVFIALFIWVLSNSAGKPSLALMVAAISIGFRPEGILLWTLSLAFTFLNRRSEIIRLALPSLVFLFAAIAVLLWCFGSLLPTGMVAKDIIYQLSPMQSLISLEHPTHRLIGSSIILPHFGVFVLILSVLLSATVLIRNQRNFQVPEWQLSLFALSFGVLTLVGYISRGTLMFFWYAPIIYVSIFIGLLFSCQLGGAFQSFRILGKGLTCLFVLLLIREAASLPLPEYHNRELEYARVVKFLEWSYLIQRCAPSVVLAAPEIGAVGAVFRGIVRDGVGIASPEALRFHPLEVGFARDAGGVGAMPTAAVVSWNPEVVIALPNLLEHGLLNAVVGRYVSISESLFPAISAKGLTPALWGQDSILVLIRRDIISPCLASEENKITSPGILFSMVVR